MKKLLIITGSLPPIKCGVGYYSQRLLSELAQNKEIELSVLTTAGVDKLPINNFQITKNWGLLSLFALLRKTKSRRPDIIHIEYPAVGYGRQLGINILPYLLRCFSPRTRIIVTLHEYHGSRLIGRLRNLVTILPVPTIVVSNQADRHALPKFLQKRVTIIPIGSNLDLVLPKPEIYKKVLGEHGLQPDKPTLLFFGFAFPNKRLEVLLEALQQPALADHQALLLTDLDIDDAYHKSLRDLVASCNTGQTRVAWTGFLPDDTVSAILQEGEIFVQPQFEPLTPKSGTALAAIQHGLIVVAADGQYTQPFESGQNCYLVAPLNAENLAQAVSTLATDEKLTKTIQFGAQNLAASFTWPAIAKAHQELYER